MYVVDADDVAHDVDRLPPRAARAFAEFRAAVELSPWTVAPSINPDNPYAPVRLHLLQSDDGSALISYLVRDLERIVDVLRLQWLG
ncbi:hypothetical protein GCM10023200_32420 [Actinomycetospora chlora]|uniref:Uncharacterized protein n=1 Tax=Actinomycetospora chlora TaxID=663608 RepID=A0ABP9BH08_9PSEU